MKNRVSRTPGAMFLTFVTAIGILIGPSVQPMTSVASAAAGSGHVVAAGVGVNTVNAERHRPEITHATTIIPLLLSGGTISSATAINDEGDATGESAWLNPANQRVQHVGFIYFTKRGTIQPGKTFPLGLPAGASSSIGNSINDGNHIAANATSDEPGQDQPYEVRLLNNVGSWTSLRRGPAMDASTASGDAAAIGAHDDVSLNAFSSVGTESALQATRSASQRYRTAPEQLTTSTSVVGSWVKTVDEDGREAGAQIVSGGGTRATLWNPNLKPVLLPALMANGDSAVLAMTEGGTLNEGRPDQSLAVPNGAGIEWVKVVGYSVNASDQYQPVLWYGHGDSMHVTRFATQTDLGIPSGFSNAEATAISHKAKYVAGYASSGRNDHAFVWLGGQPLDLNTLLGPNSGWQLQKALGVNDHGEVVGDGIYHGNETGFLLHIGRAPSPTLTLTPSTAGPDVTGTSQQLEATLLDGSGTPISGSTVTFTVTGPNATSGQAMTNGSGVASFSYSGQHLGTDSVQASANGGSILSNRASVTWVGPPTLTLSPATSGPNVTGGSQALQATLVDSNGDAMPGVSITFTVTGPNATTADANTNSSGVATFRYTGSQPGTDHVQASADSGTIVSNSATVMWTSPSTLTLSPATAGPNTIGTSQTLQATYLDGAGNGVGGVTITFTVTGANASSSTASTNASGVATFEYTGTIAGTDNVQASANSGAVTSNIASVSWIGLPSLSLSPDASGPDVTGTSQTLTADLVNARGNAIPNTPITFTVTGPNATSGTMNTNASGIASFSYTGTTAGTDTVIATAQSGTVASNMASVIWVAPPRLVLAPAAAGPDVIGTSQTLTATLTDGTGNPIGNVSVTFTVTGPNATSGSAATTTSGVATFTYSGSHAGADTVSATANAGSIISNSAQVTWAAPPSLALAPTVASPLVGTTQSLTATLQDASRNPVVGAPIAFTVTGVNPTTQTVSTNSSGIATLSYTGTNRGVDQVVASTESGTVISNTATVTWGVLPTLTLSPPASGPDTTGTSQRLTATLLDENGNPIPSASITFTVTGPNTTSGTATTNASGVAIFSYTGTAAGTDTVVATADFATVVSNMASVTWIRPPTLTLSPTTAGPDTVGTPQSLTATFLDGSSNPIAGASITFTVTGANATTGAATTNASGVATFTYAGTAPGADSIQASANSGTITSNTVAVTWVGLPTLTLSPAAAGPDATGTSQQLQATLLDASKNPIPNAAVTFTVTGANATSGSVNTDSTGIATFSYAGTNAGTDTVVATADSGTVASNMASVVWEAPSGLTLAPALNGPDVTGTAQTLTATLTDANGNPIGNSPVVFTVTGPNAMSDTVNTDSFGVATFSYTGTANGTDSVHATAESGFAVSNTATVNWITPIEPVSTTSITGTFYAGGCGYFCADVTKPLWTQSFPTIDFNPPSGTIPNSIANVDVDTRPFTDVTTNAIGDFTGTIVAQSSDGSQQAGVGDLNGFDATYTASMVVAKAGDVTFNFYDDDGFILGVGGGATPVSGGTLVNPPPATALMGYPVMGAYNDPTSPAGHQVTVDFPSAGVYPYEVDYSECCGGQLALTMATADGQGVPPAGNLSITPVNVPTQDVGQPVQLTVAAMDDSGNAIPNLPITMTVSGPNEQHVTGQTDTKGVAVLSYVGNQPGTDQVVVGASVDSMPATSNTVPISWAYGPSSSSGSPPPTITSVAPADGGVVTDPVPITASFSPPTGETIASWNVTYQRSGSSTPTMLASGNGSPPATLATFDPTLLPNGSYTITVSATASGGGTQTSSTSVVVYGNLKLGRFQASVQDLSVPVDGFQMNVNRTYDSTDKSVGDFGVGWHVSISNFRVSANRDLGAGGWTEYPTSCIFGFCNWAFKTSTEHFVTVTWPDGHDEVFDFTPTGGEALLYFQGTAAYTARAGTNTTSTLQPMPGDEAVNYSFDGNIYDGSGNIYDPTEFLLTTHSGEQIVLSTQAGLVSETDRNGNAVSVDSSGVHASNGESITYTRDSQNRITDITGPSGEHLHYDYNAAGDLADSVDANGNTTTYTYDDNHDLQSVTGASSQSLVTLSYGSDGRLQSIQQGNNPPTTISNDIAARQQTYTDPMGKLTTVDSFDAQGDLIQEDQTYVDSTTGTSKTLTSKWQYDANGHVTQYDDPLGDATTAQYDGSGDLTSLTNPNGHVTNFRYNGNGEVTSAAVQSSSGTVPLASLQYDANGNLVELDRPDGSAYKYSYDSAGNLAQITDPMNRVTTFQYDGNGHLSQVIDSAGNTTQYNVDFSGNVLSVTDANGNTTKFEYDQNDNLTDIIDAKGNDQHFAYDSLDRLTQATDPLGNATQYGYNAAGQLAQVTDRDGRILAYTYDGDGHLQSITLPGNDATSFAYDPLGRLTGADNANADDSFTYDGASRLTAQTSTGTASASEPTATLQYGYDPAGSLDSLDGPDGATQFNYDDLSRLTTLTDPNHGSFMFGYDALSRLVSLTRPNGVDDTLTYNAADDLLSRSAKLNGTPVTSSTYTYNAAGQRSSFASLTNSVAYQYDPVGQLLSATYSSSPLANESYQYDSVGNRVASPGVPAGSMQYNADNQLTTDGTYNYQYDAVGNLVKKTNLSTGAATTYAWNALGQLLDIDYSDGTTTTYRYDALGRRIEVNDNGQITRYVYDGDNIHLEYNGSNSLVASYEDAGIDNPLEMVRGGQPYYYLQDGEGSVQALTNSSGAVADSYQYKAFGQPSSTGSVTNPFTYVGREYDAKSGLYYDRARYYDPETGRFLGEDPYGSENAYPYALSDPVDFVDPFGAQALEEDAILTSFTSEVAVSSVDVGQVLVDDISGIDAASELGEIAGTSEDGQGGRLVIGKLGDLNAEDAVGPSERTLLNQLPDQGSEAANWAQNRDVLLREMQSGQPIRDVSVNPQTGALEDNTGFLARERSLLQDEGWQYNPQTHLWSPGGGG